MRGAGAGAGGFPTVIANDLPGTANDAPIELGYNQASQIVSRTVSNDAYAAPTPDNTARGYQVNGLNQYTGTTYAGAPNWTFEYDPNGNLTRSVDPAGTGTTSYVYDVENRLVASGATELVYDPLGRLAQLRDPAGVKVQFLYDGDRLIAEYDGLGNLTKRYVHGPGADEPVAEYAGSALGLANRRYTLPDERGSIAALVDSNGTPSVINRYDPWGIPGAANQGRFQYTGQAWIPELGLYYYKARFYSPYLGRFMQTDPIGYEDQINLYAYVGNDPMNRTDPTGTVQCEGDPRCGQIHAAAALARSAAQSASADLKSLAVAVKSGGSLDASQQSLLAAFERKFGTTDASGLNQVAGKLDKIADRIGVEGSGARIRFGDAKGLAIATARLGGSSMTIRPLFFSGKINMTQASVVFHEGGHLAGLRDQVMPESSPSNIGRESLGERRGYGVSATDWLGANDPALARRNNDSYHCFAIPVCGGP